MQRAPLQRSDTDSRPGSMVPRWTVHWRRLLVLFAGVLVPLCVFGFIADGVLEHADFVLDLRLLQGLHARSTPAIDQAMLFLTLLGSARMIVPVEAAVLAILLWGRRFADAFFWVVALSGASLLNVAAKHVFARVRPHVWVPIAPETSYSFPSAHAMQTTALVAAAVVLLWPTRWRWVALSIGALFVALVGTSRVYLGVHFPTDVLGGWAASLAWVLGLGVASYGRMVKPHAQAPARG